MGDFWLDEGKKYQIYSKRVLFENGELFFEYQLGMRGMFYSICFVILNKRSANFFIATDIPNKPHFLIAFYYFSCHLGFDNIYYHNGCYESGMPRSQALYIQIKSKENWQMGKVDAFFFRLPNNPF